MRECMKEMEENKEKNKNKRENEWKDWIFSCIYGPILIAQIVLVFIFYNYYGFDIISWIGWACIALFLVIGALPQAAFKKYGDIEKGGRFFESKRIVEKGIYGIIRHPYWFCWILLSLAFILLSQYWVMILIGTIACVAIYAETYQLDKNLIRKFGIEYKRYKERVPRLNILYGIIKFAIRNRD